MVPSCLRAAFATILAGPFFCSSAFASVTIAIDVSAKRHSISQNIYGVAWASKHDLLALNVPLNRMGGNATSSYNWTINAQNLGNDWYFESYPEQSGKAGLEADTLIANTKTAGAQAMITVPLIGWVANLGSGRSILPSFSVAKYGAQCDTDYWDPDAGNGLKPDCSTPIAGNDPSDSYVKDGVAKEQKWITHLVQKWGRANAGGVRYYLMDNEPSIWFSTHRDSHPVGAHATEYRDKVIAESASIKAVDPNALVVAPEEWGWEGYFYSGYDQQYAPAHGYSDWPDHRKQQHGVDYIPWLLGQWKARGHPVDVLSVHYYPQGGEYGTDDSAGTQALRNRATRELWDPSYTSESWIGAPVYMIPRLKNWVHKYYYDGTPVAITEYNWGDEAHINGATTLADVLGIYGREGLDMATYWTVPPASTPTYKAIQMYRNYDGAKSAFGDTSVAAKAPNPDNLSAFAALRARDGALTVMVVNKIASSTPVLLKLAHATVSGTAKRYQLTAGNAIQHLSNIAWSGGVMKDTVPAQSITLYVLPQ